jgi:hypothetical protein
VSARSAAEVLALPVRLHGIQIGRPVEALLDPSVDRLLGFEVECGDGEHRFLPLSVAHLGAAEITIASALQLIDERELDWYRRHTRRLSSVGYAEPWIGENGEIYEALTIAQEA